MTDPDNHPIARETSATPLAEWLVQPCARRHVLQGGLWAGVGLLAARCTPAGIPAAKPLKFPPAFRFTEIPHGVGATHALATGYSAEIIARWGDPITANAPTFDAQNQTATAQEQQFGYNNDFLCYLPLGTGKAASEHGLLWVNHEYTNTDLMLPPDLRLAANRGDAVGKAALAQIISISQAAHGGTVLELVRKNGKWFRATGSRYARRITATTPMQLRGPAAGNPRLQTVADPTGTRVLGMLGNCAGGRTPWGTVLSCEENINHYFRFPSDAIEGGRLPEGRNHARMGLHDDGIYRWGEMEDRFDARREPNEPNRFGWVVEIDPRDPNSTPIKRTALGRFKHESANCVLCPDGRVAIYMGDDQAGEYLYRFVTDQPYHPDAALPNPHLLDAGTLSVACFAPEGTLEWRPLVFGQGPLTPENRFYSQADVLIETRRAADLVGATPLDRPEDVEPHPTNGRVYVALTKNPTRSTAPDAANPRTPNPLGHMLELIAPTRGGKPDHAATMYDWSLFLQGGDPHSKTDKSFYLAPPSPDGWLVCPDNLAIDPRGNLWICTDGMRETKKRCDGLFVAPLDGPWRGRPHSFFRAPAGAEVTGPCFTPDGTTLFLSVQHPGLGADADYADPTTRWPDFAANPPRPSVLAITADDGGVVGA